AQQRTQVLGQRRRPALPQRGEVVGAVGVAAVRAPQVGGQLLAQFAVVGQQRGRVEALPAFQRVLAQRAGAEAVDGEDRREVDLQRGLAQAAAERFGAFAAAL